MLLRPLVMRMLLCVAIVTAVSRAQALPRCDDGGSGTIASVTLCHCHHPSMFRRSSHKDVCDRGSCASVASALDLPDGSFSSVVSPTLAAHCIDYGSFKGTRARKPPYPPPKLS